MCVSEKCWNKLRQLAPFLTDKDTSMHVQWNMYSSCLRSCMSHRREKCPVRKENELALACAEMRMVRWMCGVRQIVLLQEIRGVLR